MLQRKHGQARSAPTFRASWICALTVIATGSAAFYLGLPLLAPVRSSISASDPHDGDTFNFGEVGQGESYRHDFLLRNEDGSQPLQIVAVRTSCMCTTVPDDLLGTTIAPNSSVTVPLTLRTGTATGSTSAALVISTMRQLTHGWNDERVDRRFIVKANVVPLFQVQPESIDFGNVSDGQPLTQALLISSRCLDDVSVVSATSLEPAFSVAIDDRGAVSNNECSLRITFAPDSAAKQRTYAGFVHINTTSERVPVISVPVRARFSPRVTVRPHVAIFSGATRDQPITLEVHSATPSRISAITSTTSAFVTVAEPQSASPRTVHHVTITPATSKSVRGELQMSLLLEPATATSDMDCHCTVTIPMFHLGKGN